MASVHLARQPALDRDVALKELHPARARDATFAQRFLNESRLAGALNHPSVVSVIEYFEHEGVPFIAMEYLERGSLRPLVGRLTLAQVAGVLDSVLAGLAEAAAQGIVHRDLKPENVLVTADGRAKVGDFGIAKAIGQLRMTELRTATGEIVGTPAYMAPEQITGGEITPQVDLYATGLLAYELLAGQHPFHGIDAPMALLMCHVNDDPPPLATVRPDLPPGVAAWVHGMLAKEPATRPAGAAHAWDRLEGVVSDALGPRWRRSATLPAVGPAAVVVPPSAAERSGIYSIMPSTVVPVHSEPAPAFPAPSPAKSATAEPFRPAEAAPEPAGAARDPHPAPAVPAPSQPPHSTPKRPARRRLALFLLPAAALLVALAVILYSTAPGEEPRAAQRPAGPPIDERLRDAITPALQTHARLSKELSSLVPGADPADARERWLAAVGATEEARIAVRELRATTASDRLLRARVRRALSTQSDYLEVVRAALRLQTDEGQLDDLGPLSARLVSRLERIESAVPRASLTVGGARRLKEWVSAELAAAQAPAAFPAAPPVTPAPLAG